MRREKCFVKGYQSNSILIIERFAMSIIGLQGNREDGGRGKLLDCRVKGRMLGRARGVLGLYGKGDLLLGG